ncbi:ABC transporter permease [Anaerocolumna sedimenticola]|uniref:ABC transporter permease n=1 Tax=Anaerocolumna sedimenticola TaxID=2696063 RepID=A0A6P1TSU7_9FIRM|nr:ABC transporter permease [Anaerocolumna sedimenticola]QHQ62806.1 ABC transporter permease [Anaerocolumna sedimenticola]
MQVFNLYFKLLKSVAPALIIYAVIFVILIFIISTDQAQNITHFEETKIDTALVNYDEDSIFSKNLINYLSNYCNFKDYGDDEDNLADALFFRQVEYILTIPYDFGEDFYYGKDVAVEKRAIPDGVYNSSVDHAINNYLNTARNYLRNLPNISEEELVSYVNQDMQEKTEVTIANFEKQDNNFSFYNRYFNTASYIILSSCLIGVGMIMLTFHNVHILRRNMVTPMTHKDMNLQLIGGNLIFVLTHDILFALFGFIINDDKSVTGNLILFWLNMIVYSISALSISYFMAVVIKNKQVNDIMAYVLPLGFSFISGAFIPQFILGDSVLKLASFTPVYWFVKGNDTIALLTDFNGNFLSKIYAYMLIQVGFAAAIFSLSLVVSKNRKLNN